MTTKFISLATGIVTLDVYLQSQLSSNDPLFLLISNNTLVNISMVLIAATAVVLSFRKRFMTWGGFAACATLATILLAFGGMGMFFSSVNLPLWGVFLPLNYLLFAEVGVILGVSCLSYKHPSVPATIRLPRFSVPALPYKLAFPVPKISHSPTTFRSISSTN